MMPLKKNSQCGAAEQVPQGLDSGTAVNKLKPSSNVVLMPCQTKCINFGNVFLWELLSRKYPLVVSRKNDFP